MSRIQSSLLRRPLFWYYGIGAVPYGIKDNAFAYLLLIYANQCLGIPGWQAALAMMIALLWDAVTDLFVGHWSDKTHSRLGRRHPFMYGGLVLLPLAFWALFNPIIDLTNSTTAFIYVLVLAILVRSGVTLFEVPNTALLPDMERNYDKRNSWLALRYFLGWYGGNGAQVINITFFVGALGFANPQGYALYAWFGGLSILMAIAISSLGTQRLAATLPPPRHAMRWRDIGSEFRDMLQSLRNRNFAALFAYSLCFYVAAGLGAALYLYNMRYFFGMSHAQLSFLALVIFLGPLFGAALVPSLAKRWGKKSVAVSCILGFVFLYPIPYVAVLYDMWPPLGSWQSAYGLGVISVLEVALITLQGTLISSMIADVVEDSQVQTKRRSEGLFYAMRSFAAKFISAGGVVGAGIIVSAVGFDAVQSLDDVTYDLRRNLVVFFMPAYAGFILLGAVCIGFYGITRRMHEANLARIDS